MKLGYGGSTNTQAELLALWVLLYVANCFRLPKLKIFGDSKVIIDLANNSTCLRVVELNHWCTLINLLKGCFFSLCFQQIYSEHDHIADGLSKEVVHNKNGYLSLMEFIEGDKTMEVSYHIFD